MQDRTNDPGFGERYFSETKRMINPDGSFNIIKKGTGFSPRDVFQYLVNISWPKFFGIIAATYLLLNLLFSALFMMAGPEKIMWAVDKNTMNSYLNIFFFSVQTFTTIGYGHMYPEGLGPNLIMTVESATGLMSFALATGLLYGRFSRPTAKILFSQKAIIAPYKNITSFQFRIANRKRNMLMEIEAKIMLAFVEKDNGQSVRRYYNLDLERSYIYFFPLSWTIVHPIEESSPLYGKTTLDLQRLEAEFLILIKGFDDTFSQTVHSRFSYRFDEIVWNARFKRAFFIDDNGDIIFDLDNLHALETESGSGAD